MATYQYLLTTLMKTRRAHTTGANHNPALMLNKLLGDKECDDFFNIVSFRDVLRGKSHIDESNAVFCLNNHDIFTVDDNITCASITRENITSHLRALPRSSEDGMPYGLLLLKDTNEKYKFLNFIVDKENIIYFIDTQKRLFPVLKRIPNKFQNEIICIQSEQLTIENILSSSEEELEDDLICIDEKNKQDNQSQTYTELNKLGIRYLNGIDVEYDPNKAFNYFTHALKLNPHSSVSKNFLGLCFLNGTGVERNVRLAFNFFKGAVSSNLLFSEAWYNLAYCYKNGFGIPVNSRMAFRCFKEADKVNSKFALVKNDLGECFLNGFGTQANQTKALEYFNSAIAIDPKCAPALNSIGTCYLHGLAGLEKNMEAAFEYFKSSVEHKDNYSKGWNNLGFCFLNGVGTEINLVKAFQCFENATTTDPRYAPAWQTLGLCYQQGIGTEKNLQLSEICFKNIAYINAGALEKVTQPILESHDTLHSIQINDEQLFDPLNYIPDDEFEMMWSILNDNSSDLSETLSFNNAYVPVFRTENDNSGAMNSMTYHSTSEEPNKKRKFGK